MNPQREDFHKLPPIARAQAMHRPYKPSRKPIVYGLLITLAVNLAWGAWALFGSNRRVLPDWVFPKAVVVYTTIQPPRTTPPPPRVEQAATTGPAVESAPSETPVSPADTGSVDAQAAREAVPKTRAEASAAAPAAATETTAP